MSVFIGFVILIALIILYFAPTIIAINRNHRQTGGIVILNLILGWTLLGWVVALIWSVAAGEAKPAAIARDRPFDTRKCPYCAEIIKAEAKVCRYCGRDVEPVSAGAPGLEAS